MKTPTKALRPNKQVSNKPTKRPSNKTNRSPKTNKGQTTEKIVQHKGNSLKIFGIFTLLLVGVTASLLYSQNTKNENVLISQQTNYIEQGRWKDAQEYTANNLTNPIGLFNKRLYTAYNKALIKYSNSIPDKKYTYKKYKFLMTLTKLGTNYTAVDAKKSINSRYDDIMYTKYNELYDRFNYVITDRALHTLEKDINKFHQEGGGKEEWSNLQDRLKTFKQWRGNAY